MNNLFSPYPSSVVIIAKKNEEKRKKKRKVLDNGSNTNIVDKRGKKMMHARTEVNHCPLTKSTTTTINEHEH
jgi:hypothetical protein